jgi:hypothetical protein
MPIAIVAVDIHGVVFTFPVSIPAFSGAIFTRPLVRLPAIQEYKLLSAIEAIS